ncbi:MAG: thioredoxin family protein [Sphingorhabdus sp.]
MKSSLLGIGLLQTVIHIPAPVSQPVALPTESKALHSEPTVYLADRDAQADVDQALAAAKQAGKRVIVIMGANWCHDSKGLAGWFATPRFAAMLDDRYEVVYVDVGAPQTGRARNLDIAQRFGIKKVKTTPVVMILSPDGKRLNSQKDAAGWHNAASRSENAIFDYFNGFTPT